MSKNYKGGYKIINLGNIELTGVSIKIDGIYEKIEHSYRKPLLLSGIVIDGVEKKSIFVKAEVVDSNYVIKDVYGYILTITDEDGITLSEEPSGSVTRQEIVEASGLVLPLQAPQSEELVGIDTSGGQSSVRVGDGLEIDNGEMKFNGFLIVEQLPQKIGQLVSMLGIEIGEFTSDSKTFFLKTTTFGLAPGLYKVGYINYGSLSIYLMGEESANYFRRNYDSVTVDINAATSFQYFLRVPSTPDDRSKTFVLKSVGGEVQWVEE